MEEKLKTKYPILNNPKDFLGHKVTVLNQHPPIVKISGLLSPWDCQHMIKLAGPKLASSTMIVNNKEVVNPARSSRSAFLTKSGHLPDDPVIHRLLTKVSKLTNIPVTHFEGLKVVNYQKGQEYKGHHDYFQNHDNFTKGTGDRMLTFFIYLNDLAPEDGGATSFPKLNIKSQPEAGAGVFWVNLDGEGAFYDETIHAGEPVLRDTEKWGVNIWIRERPYQD